MSCEYLDVTLVLSGELSDEKDVAVVERLLGHAHLAATIHGEHIPHMAKDTIIMESASLHDALTSSGQLAIHFSCVPDGDIYDFQQELQETGLSFTIINEGGNSTPSQFRTYMADEGLYYVAMRDGVGAPVVPYYKITKAMDGDDPIRMCDEIKSIMDMVTKACGKKRPLSLTATLDITEYMNTQANQSAEPDF